MKEEYKDLISEKLGVEPVLLNSNKVCAADRKRFYWTNIPNSPKELEDKGVLLRDIMEEAEEVEEKYWYTKKYTKSKEDKKVLCTLEMKGHRHMKEVHSPNYKCNTLTTCGGGNTRKKVYQSGRCRKLTPLEYERLQTLPDKYTEGVADSHRYTAIGNGWTVDVIVDLLKGLK